MRGQVVRRWHYALLLLVPLIVYWSTVFHEYGFRDDYAHLREAREIPGRLIAFTSSYGRPLYGTLLVASVRPLGGEVEHLQWLRLASVFLLALIGIVLMRLLRRAGWPVLESGAVGLAITLLPAAQVTVGWSIAWPIALALLLSLGGFAAADVALRHTGSRRWSAWAAGVAGYVAAGLIYQPSALFFVVPLAAALLCAHDSARARVQWCAAHLATALGGLAAGFVAMRLVFALGWLSKSAVVAFETDPLGKLGWFVSMPVANSLSLFVLRDSFDTPAAFWIAALLVAAVITFGFAVRRNREPIDQWTALFCLAALPMVGFAVNLAAALRVPSYRTTYALAGLVVVFVVYALSSLKTAGIIGRKVQWAALGILLAFGAVAANRHAYTLIAEPQGWEWQIVHDAAFSLPITRAVDIYAIRSTIEDRATQRTFADEFGSLSSDTEWAVSEMLKCALRDRFPSGLPESFSYTLTTGLEPPYGGRYDKIIDMRTLRAHRTD